MCPPILLVPSPFLNLSFHVKSVDAAGAPAGVTVSFNFLDVIYGGSNYSGGDATPFNLLFTVLNTSTGQTGTANLSATLVPRVTNGFGTLTLAPASIIPATPVPGVTFGPITFTSPTIAGTSPSTGNLSTTVTFTAVPEPASLALVGLGLAGVGGLALRRRSR